MLKLKPRIDIGSGSLVKIIKKTVVGSYPPCYMPIRLENRIASRLLRCAQRYACLWTREDRRRPLDKFDIINMYDDDSGSEDESQELEKEYLCTSFNLNDYLRSRESNLTEQRAVNLNYASRHLLTQDMFRETQISLPGYNKVFCSQWISSKQIVFGTQCNKLLVYDVNKRRVDDIPLLSHGHYNYDVDQNGLYAIEINPSRTYLATRATVSTDVAVYRLPTFDPVCVGSKGQRNLMMDICWLDDQFFVSGSNDSQIALWRINEDHMDFPDGSQEAGPTFASILPISVKNCGPAQRICSLCFNKDYNEIAVLSFQGYIHIFNAETFKQKLTRKLPNRQDNVSLSYHHTGLYAVGCRLYTLLLDARTLQIVKKIESTNGAHSIKSTSFQHNIVTIGTGLGMLTFYDLRAEKYLESKVNASSIVVLNTNKGIVHPEEDINGLQQSNDIPGIYTHCYDSAGIRIFAGGGPLSASLFGNYTGIWQ